DHADQNNEGNGEIHNTGKGVAEWESQTRKVHLLNEITAAHDAIRGRVQCLRKIRPRNQSGIAEEWVGNSIRRDFRQAPEKDTKYDHREEWLDDRPSRA